MASDSIEDEMEFGLRTTGKKRNYDLVYGPVVFHKSIAMPMRLFSGKHWGIRRTVQEIMSPCFLSFGFYRLLGKNKEGSKRVNFCFQGLGL